MKFLTTLLIALFSITCFSQWKGIYFHADQESAIEVLNKDTIIAVTGSDGRIHRSTDGGESWSFYQTIFTEELLDIHFPTNLVGYACGGSSFGPHHDIIVKTTDGGETWDSLYSEVVSSSYYFRKIRFINADTGFVVPMTGKMRKTTDGGNTFTEIPLLHPKMLGANEICIKQDEKIFVVLWLTQSPGVSAYSISRSEDLGATWTTVYSGDYKIINDIFFVNNTVGYAVGGEGLFLKTTDGGASWTSATLQPGVNLTSVHFISPDVGYINNAGGIYRTVDGGQSWTVQNVNPPSIVHQIQFANDTVGYALAGNGIYKTTNGGSTSILRNVHAAADFAIFPNPALDKITITSLGKGFSPIAIYNHLGEKVMDVDSEGELDVSTLASGLYVLVVRSDKGLISSVFSKQ